MRLKSKTKSKSLVVFTLVISSLFMGGRSNATSSWCGVFDFSNDKYLNLRSAPSASYPIIGRITKQMLLTVDTATCRNDFLDGIAEFGREICAKNKSWVFVEQAFSADGNTTLKGWANSRFIRQVACQE